MNTQNAEFDREPPVKENSNIRTIDTQSQEKDEKSQIIFYHSTNHKAWIELHEKWYVTWR